MSKTTLYTSDFITVDYLHDHETIFHAIHRPIMNQTAIFKEALTTGADALAEYNCTKWLSDDRKNGPLDQELLDWAFKEWNLATIQKGWKYWANVIPEDMVAAGSLTPVIHELANYGLRMQVFTSLDQALAWLDQQN